VLTGFGTIAIALAAAAPSGAASPPPRSRIVVAQVQIRQRVIVRVPTRQASRVTIRWRERSAPRCLPLRGLAGAAVVDGDSVDLMFQGGGRIRAKLESDCSGLDFYSGFYLTPTEDRRICAGRDSIHARSGGQCEIKRFRSLVPDD